MTPDAARDAILAAARRHGAHRVATLPIEPPRRHELYRSWLARGEHGAMSYLAEPAHVAGRGDLGQLLSGARTLVVLAFAHDRGPPPGTTLAGLRGKLARYATGDDYHLVVRDKLQAIAGDLATAVGAPVAARACVDTAPVHEREWAERGGLGFVAKNTLVIAPGLGSYVLLGELLLDLDATPSAPAAPPAPRCGACRACLDACPTGAFVDAYHLDARRCISYLTIEHAGPIPRELRALVGTWIFGCDVCQEVCPWNAGQDRAPDRLPARDAERALPDLVMLAGLGTNQLRHYVRRTALRRVHRAQLLRNVAVALGNTGDARAIAPLRALLAGPLPLVRGHAAWALGQLGRAGILPDADAILARAQAIETDPDAQAELVLARADLTSPGRA
ncbi:MAG: tRNA epoxyqueuosine(34) reductase QueG [Deltaproteobacteria bacterium]|nr:tRNA epoxyqueuosine(34) reductase QueG [Deltaproteobacteria bacterium]